MTGIAGKWYNELGSYMEIEVSKDPNTGIENLISGTYYTAVEDARGVIQHNPYPLIGYYDTLTSGSSNAVGFTVVWQKQDFNATSVTTWSGQFRAQSNIISAMWVLTFETTEQKQWSSHFLNKDVFTRNPPSKEEIQKHLEQGKHHSHPMN